MSSRLTVRDAEKQRAGRALSVRVLGRDARVPVVGGDEVAARSEALASKPPPAISKVLRRGMGNFLHLPGLSRHTCARGCTPPFGIYKNLPIPPATPRTAPPRTPTGLQPSRRSSRAPIKGGSANSKPTVVTREAHSRPTASLER